MLQIYCKNNNSTKEFAEGITLLDIYHGLKLDLPYGPVSARVNNVVRDLNYKLFSNKDVEFIDITCQSGMRTYIRSLCFVLVKAVEDLYPNGRISFEHPASKGFFCRLHIDRETGLDDVTRLKQRMKEIIDEDLPMIRTKAHTDEVIKIFEERGMTPKVKLLKTSGKLYSSYYTLADTVDYYYGSLLPSTGYIHLFDLVKYYDGMLLRIPNMKEPNKLEEVIKQEKMLEVFNEYQSWNNIMQTSTIGDFNMTCLAGKAPILVKVSEALQEKKIANIADDIARRGNVKMVLISGPSSSGKTTFSVRLSVQLLTNKILPYPISLDDYFVDREHTPKDENGNYDFESLYALDIPYFENDLKMLLEGKEIELPRFNFTTGKREMSGKKLRLTDNMVLILEGIHALNPALTPEIPKENKYMIYVSALTTILLDYHNYIPTADNRLIRRIIRDAKYRNYSAQETISRWPSVRKGEEKWIFPYQENADAMFNSALVFELSVLKSYAEPLLRTVPNNCPEYAEAHRLLNFLSYLIPIKDNELPPTSLLREFLGGSSFRY